MANLQFFLLGANFMFAAFMAWIFMRKGSDLLSRLVMWLMIIIAIGFLKDALLLNSVSSISQADFSISAIWDAIAVPVYAFILVELCQPGKLTVKNIIVTETPFIILPVLFCIFHLPIFYFTDMVLAVVLGLGTAIWTFFAIPRYYKFLKSSFSYDENLSLKWLNYILCTFFVLLFIWAWSCFVYNPWLDISYMVTSLMLWAFICYFLSLLSTKNGRG